MLPPLSDTHSQQCLTECNIQLFYHYNKIPSPFFVPPDKNQQSAIISAKPIHSSHLFSTPGPPPPPRQQPTHPIDKHFCSIIWSLQLWVHTNHTHHMTLWVELGYVPTAHILILFSVPCIVLRVEPSQKYTFFCPLSGGVIFFFDGGFLVQKLHPKNWFHKSGVPPLNPIFLRAVRRVNKWKWRLERAHSKDSGKYTLLGEHDTGSLSKKIKQIFFLKWQIM